MNQIIIYPHEITTTHSSTSTLIQIAEGKRSSHIHHILKAQKGDQLKILLLNQGRGMAQVLESQPTFCLLELLHFTPLPNNSWCHLILGISRPPTMRKILEHASCMGVRSFHLIPTELSEKSYSQSKIWKDKEYEQYLELGLSQSSCYGYQPEVFLYPSIKNLLQKNESLMREHFRYILHPYQTSFFHQHLLPTPRIGDNDFSPLFLAIGSERGWTTSEYESFLQAGFKGVKISAATLRVEMSVFYALAQLELLLSP